MKYKSDDVDIVLDQIIAEINKSKKVTQQVVNLINSVGQDEASKIALKLSRSLAVKPGIQHLSVSESIKVFLGFIETLIRRKIIKQCPRCKRYFMYKRNKIYCRQKEDGLDCKGEAADERYYYKNRNKILAKLALERRKRMKKRVRKIEK
jgi:hypothetical protein